MSYICVFFQTIFSDYFSNIPIDSFNLYMKSKQQIKNHDN